MAKKEAAEEYNVEELLATFTQLNEGCSTSSVVDSFSDFLFHDNKAIALDGNMIVVTQSPFDFECSINAGRLLNFLRKSAAKEFSISLSKNQIKGKNKKTSFGLNTSDPNEDTLELINTIDYDAMTFKKLPKGFQDSLLFCAASASDNVSSVYSGVFITGKEMFSSKGISMTRCAMSKSIGKDILIPAFLAAKTMPFKLESFCLDKSRIHFKTEDDFFVSLLLTSGEYPIADMKKHLKNLKAKSKYKLPKKELLKSIDTVSLLQGDMPELDRVMVLKFLKKTIICKFERPDFGWVEERIKVKESFVSEKEIRINPLALKKILATTTEMGILDDTKVLFHSEASSYLVALS